SLFDAGDPRRNAHHHPRLGQEPAMVHLLDEVPQHLLGDVEVGDDAVLERPYRLDVGGGAPDHPLRLGPHRKDRLIGGIDGYNAWFIEDDATSAHVDQRVGCPQVHSHVTAQKCSETLWSWWWFGGDALKPALAHRVFVQERTSRCKP